MAPKLRVYNLARELNLDNAEIIRELQHMGVPVTSHSNTVDDRQAALLRKKFAVAEAPKPAPEVVKAKPAKPSKAEPAVEQVEAAQPVEAKAEPKIIAKPETTVAPAPITPVAPAAPVAPTATTVAEPKAPPIAAPAPPAPPAATVAPPPPSTP